jgi:Cys-tRNA(Pro)/Cys-tRNA(Cys) deacylase
MNMRNNVTRMLDARGISYQAIPLPDDRKLSAVEVAAILGVPSEQVFKTIVLKRLGKGKPILAVIPGPAEVDLKAAAAAAGEKKVSLPSQREAEALTGHQAGGISALALYDKGFEVLLDEFAEVFEEIYVSGGERGLDIRIAVIDFVALTGARVAPICGPGA